MLDTPILRAEHEEFRRAMEVENKRLEDENNRQNHRIEVLEKSTEQIQILTSSVEKLAVSVENMVKEMEQQNDRLKTLENRDGEMWRKVTGYLITAVLGVVIGYIFTQIGM